MSETVKIGNIPVGAGQPFVLIAGPCVIEGRDLVLQVAETLKDVTTRLGIPFVFKASYDKANRTSIKSFRGPGLDDGLKILQAVKDELDVPVLSDVHTPEECSVAGDVLDVLQIPAFLCRQTDLLVAAAKTGKVVNIKKGQFLAPSDMTNVIRKVEDSGNKNILLTERGTTFGYNNLVSDFRSLAIMKASGYPVIFDATHSVQQPGGLGDSSGGCREYVPLLSRCALAAGCDGIFMETHPDPDQALSDGPNMWPLGQMEKLLKVLKEIDQVVKAGV